jgi:hypothetical protein
MSTPSAKDLLEQADQLIRRSRSTDDLPVLTELVSDAPLHANSAPPHIPDLTEFVDAPASYAARVPLPEVEETSIAKDQSAVRSERSERTEPMLGIAAAPLTQSRSTFASPTTRRNEGDGAATYTREQFDAAILAKLEQVQHSVYSQVMQQLELHATGEMKRKLREALEPALTQVALDIAAQVSEETSIQVQSIVSNAVENEVARLREQIESKRRDR